MTLRYVEPQASVHQYEGDGHLELLEVDRLLWEVDDCHVLLAKHGMRASRMHGAKMQM